MKKIVIVVVFEVPMKFVILAHILKSCLDISTHPMIVFLMVRRIFNLDLSTMFICYIRDEVYSARNYLKVDDTEHLADDFIINNTVF